MKKSIVSILVAGSALSLVSAPVVKENSVTLTQSSGLVTIGYTLEGDAGIVTVDIQTNGVSIGGQNLAFMAGDVNKIVQPGDRTITWKPYKAWPDHNAANTRAVVSAWAKDAPPDYMVVSLSADNSVRYFASSNEVPYGITDDRYKTEYLLLRKIPAGNVEWRMGSPSTESWRDANKEAPRLVTLSDDYYMGVYEVSQKQYALIYGSNPSTHTTDGDMKPVEGCWYHHLRGSSGCNWPNDGHAVSDDSFFGKLRAKTGVTGFDLPTEAQWEFACRAGCGAGLYSGKEAVGWDKDANVAELAVNNGYQTLTCTEKVGTKVPNAFGLYDMLGNVQEWCLDWLTDATPAGGTDPKGPTSGSNRVLRGGGYIDKAQNCRCASRSFMVPNWSSSSIGFRVACSIEK